MTGMKEGAGEDPFADDESAIDHDDSPEPAQTEISTRPEQNEQRSTGSTTNRRSVQIPYKFRRDSVQEERDRVPLFLHEETKQNERDAQREMESRFGDNVSLTDLREALVRAGLENLDEVETQLEEWGYGVEFEQ